MFMQSSMQRSVRISAVLHRGSPVCESGGDLGGSTDIIGGLPVFGSVPGGTTAYERTVLLSEGTALSATVTIGRGSPTLATQPTMTLASTAMSKLHCALHIALTPDGSLAVAVEDLGSVNGTVLRRLQPCNALAAVEQAMVLSSGPSAGCAIRQLCGTLEISLESEGPLLPPALAPPLAAVKVLNAFATSTPAESRHCLSLAAVNPTQLPPSSVPVMQAPAVQLKGNERYPLPILRASPTPYAVCLGKHNTIVVLVEDMQGCIPMAPSPQATAAATALLESTAALLTHHTAALAAARAAAQVAGGSSGATVGARLPSTQCSSGSTISLAAYYQGASSAQAAAAADATPPQGDRRGQSSAPRIHVGEASGNGPLQATLPSEYALPEDPMWTGPPHAAVPALPATLPDGIPHPSAGDGAAALPATLLVAHDDDDDEAVNTTAAVDHLLAAMQPRPSANTSSATAAPPRSAAEAPSSDPPTEADEEDGAAPLKTTDEVATTTPVVVTPHTFQCERTLNAAAVAAVAASASDDSDADAPPPPPVAPHENPLMADIYRKTTVAVPQPDGDAPTDDDDDDAVAAHNPPPRAQKSGGSRPFDPTVVVAPAPKMDSAGSKRDRPAVPPTPPTDEDEDDAAPPARGGLRAEPLVPAPTASTSGGGRAPPCDNGRAPPSTPASAIESTPAPRTAPTDTVPMAAVVSATSAVAAPAVASEWQFKSDLRKSNKTNAAWTSYAAADSAIIDAAYELFAAATAHQAKKKLQIASLNSTYSVDFVDMIQFRADDVNRQRPIRKKP